MWQGWGSVHPAHTRDLSECSGVTDVAGRISGPETRV